MITAEDEELIMQSISEYRKQGAIGPWHIAFHPAVRPDWVQVDGLITTEGDVYFHPDWIHPKETMSLHGDLEWKMNLHPPVSPN